MTTLRNAQPTSGFPSAAIEVDGLLAPIEVHLIGQLGHGQGDALVAASGRLQREYPGFVDEHDEPSVRIGDLQPARGDRSSLYTFSVGSQGHPFHRHLGPRVFTAIAGSSGAILRFSTNAGALDAGDLDGFIASLRQVHVPPDGLFTVRFGGGVWHQFLPAGGKADHPALFAISCHTDETAGIADASLLERVYRNRATIPALTELLPESLRSEVAKRPAADFPTMALSLEPVESSALVALCARFRSAAGRLRRGMTSLLPSCGFASISRRLPPVRVFRELPHDSLLIPQLGGSHGHDDTFRIELAEAMVIRGSAPTLLAAVLQGFLDHRSSAVTGLMRFRNALIRPLGLRRSPLGCPVSSLLSEGPCERFAGRYPVLDQAVTSDGRKAEVMLGADDWHLRFRSSVSVERRADGVVIVQLANRVAPSNAFGRLYMSAISATHRRVVGPRMLRSALAEVLVPQGFGAVTPPRTHPA